MREGQPGTSAIPAAARGGGTDAGSGAIRVVTTPKDTRAVARTAVVEILTAITGGLLAIVAGLAGYPVGLTLLAAALFLGGTALAASWIWVDWRRQGMSVWGSTRRAVRGAFSPVSQPRALVSCA